MILYIIRLLLSVIFSFSPAYFDWVYALMPSKWRYDRACRLVHKFSMDVIKERRSALADLHVMEH